MNLSYRNDTNARITAAYWKKPLSETEFFKINNLGENEEEILLYDIIGWPFNDAYQLVNYMRSIKNKDVTMKINTPGGDVFDGLAIYRAMTEHEGNMTVIIDSLAASIGSIIALGGKERKAYGSSMMMIHEPWMIAMGDQYDFMEDSGVLSKISNNLIDIYAENSSYKKRELKEEMKITKAGIWLTAKQMQEKGLIHSIIEKRSNAKAQNKFDLSIFDGVPEWVLNSLGDDSHSEEIRKRDAEKALRDAGISANKAKAILARGWNSDQRDVGVSNKESEEIEEVMAATRKFINAIR